MHGQEQEGSLLQGGGSGRRDNRAASAHGAAALRRPFQEGTPRCSMGGSGGGEAKASSSESRRRATILTLHDVRGAEATFLPIPHT